MSCRGGFAAAWTSLATGSRAATTPNATTATNTEKWTTAEAASRVPGDGCRAGPEDAAP
jgi:hypothetical protein